MKKNVFISYNHSNSSKEEIRKIANRLNSTGIKTWLDEFEIKPGDVISKKISKALDNSSYVVAVISPEDKNSQWTNKELELAVSKNKYIIPLMINHAKPEDLPESIKDRLAIDISENFENIKKIYSVIDGERSSWDRLKEYIIND